MSRIIGAIAAAIGVIGLILSVYAGVKIWSLAHQVARATDNTLVQMQAIVEPIHRQSDAAVIIVDATRERFDSIKTSVELLSDAEKAEQPEVASMLKTLDQHVIQRLDTAEEFIRTMQDNMRSASSALLLLDSIPFLSPRLASNADQRESQLQSLATTLTEISDLLEQVAQILVEVRSQSSVDPNQLERLQYGLEQIDERLDEFDSEVRRFSESIGRMEAILLDFQRRAPQRINQTAMLLTAFFVCFGCSQLSLLTHGCHIARRGRGLDLEQGPTSTLPVGQDPS